MNRLTCTACNLSYDINEPRWACDCGGVLNMDFDARIDPASLASRGSTIWRYREAIPIADDDDENIITLGEGMTPLREYTMAGRKVLIKEEYVNPTGSFKDRGASVLVSKVRQLGIGGVVEDSSGNAGAAVAAYCGEAGVRCKVYVPESVRPEKAARISQYGAELKLVRGNREDCKREALKAAGNTYYASHSHNPFFLQGTKTFAYEICEQLDWRAPDAVVLPVGNGTLLLGAYIGFRDLLAAGLIGDIPRLIAIQAKPCAPLFHAFHGGTDAAGGRLDLRPEETMADGIAVASPVRGGQVLEAVRNSGGNFFAVDDLEIVAAQRDAAYKGFQIEPTAAATIAGLARYLARGEPDGIVVSAFTGNNAPSAQY